MKTFLTAQWNNLIIITYAVDPKQLLSYLPSGLELDTREGKAFISFVAFEFNNIRVKGFKIPFHSHFPEINLRFYVKKENKRGVVFIKEFVPKYFVALVANKIYNEPYHSIPMHVKTEMLENEIKSEHRFIHDKQSYSLSVIAENKSYIPMDNSIEHFFKEHDIGFGKEKNGNTLFYYVHHPVWEIYPIKKCILNIDFEKVYGNNFEFLNSQKPHNVLFAKGSEISVFNKQK